jgi:VWFA-related protein
MLRIWLFSVMTALYTVSGLAQQQAAPSTQTATPAQEQSASASSVSAQDGAKPAGPTQNNTLQVNTRIVILDVSVVDTKTGKVITDLKQSDFHVTEQKVPQTITHFYGPGFFTPKPDVTINSTADLDAKARQAPVNVIVLDEFNTLFEDMAFARYSLKKWLEKQPEKLDAPTMLCAVTLDKFTVVKDYTQDKQAIMDALEHHFVAYPWQAHNFAWVAERTSNAILTLDRVAEATVGHPGHKNLIWIGRGLPTLRWSSLGVDEQERVNSTFQRTVNELRDARVTLYTIDPAGVMTDPGRYGSTAQMFAPFGGDPDFESMAQATGGRTLHGRNDVDTEIGSAIEDGNEIYSFSYRPTDNSDDTYKFRNISVAVDRPGVTVYARKGYYVAMRPPRTGNDGSVGRKLVTELEGAGESNMVYDAVRFEAHNDPSDLSLYKFHLEPQTLSWYFARDGSKPRWTNILLLITTYDKKGKVLSDKLQKATFTAKPGYKQEGGHIDIPLDIEFRMPPDPKAVRVKFTVRVESSGHMGTVEIPLGQAVNVASF